MTDDITRYEDRKAKADKLDGEITWAWETWVDSFEDLDEFIDGEYYKELGYDSGLAYVQGRLMPITDKAKLMANYRQPIVQILVDAGYSNRAIAGALGLNEGTIRRDRKALETTQTDDADGVRTEYAPNEVDAAGQSVEEVGHIDDGEPQLPLVTNPTFQVAEKWKEVPNANDDKKRLDSWLDSISFDSMIISTPPTQIIETEPSGDTQDYFTPRQPAPSWSPPQVRELPPTKVEAYDEAQDDTPEFLEPPMKLQKVGQANKEPSDKHCRTCACNLLP